MARKIYLGLHGALSPGEDRGPGSNGNQALDRLGNELGCPVYDFPAATHPDPLDLDPVSSKPGRELGYQPSQALKYLIRQILAADGPVSIRLFGWSTGAIMLCEVAKRLADCPAISKKARRVDLCFAMDPLWSLAPFNVFPKFPANVRRWVCVRQNRSGNRPPTLNPLSDRFWQGVRLKRESRKTRYDEINIPFGRVVGSPGFTLPERRNITHGEVPGLAWKEALRVLTE